MIRSNIKNGQLTDPVCGMLVKKDNAQAQTTLDGQVYYFCAAQCKRSFDANPEKYLAKIGKKKGVWGRYLDRLNKTTGGKPPACCG